MLEIASLLVVLTAAVSVECIAVRGGTGSSDTCTRNAIAEVRRLGIMDKPKVKVPALGPATSLQEFITYPNFEAYFAFAPNSCSVSTITLVAKVRPFHVRLNNLSKWLKTLNVRSESSPLRGFESTVTTTAGKVSSYTFTDGTPVITVFTARGSDNVMISKASGTDAPGLGVFQCRGVAFFFLVPYHEAGANVKDLWPSC